MDKTVEELLADALRGLFVVTSNLRLACKQTNMVQDIVRKGLLDRASVLAADISLFITAIEIDNNSK